MYDTSTLYCTLLAHFFSHEPHLLYTVLSFGGDFNNEPAECGRKMRFMGAGLGLLPRGPSARGFMMSSLAWRGIAVRGFAAGGRAFATTFPFGLTNTSATDNYFTTQLDMDAPLLLRDTRADFMQAACADAAERGLEVKEYLSVASRACSAFLCSGVLHNREEVKRALRNVFEATGQFALFLGGKNVGKSLLLKDL